jgi:hypothetical protein
MRRFSAKTQDGRQIVGLALSQAEIETDQERRGEARVHPTS